MNSDAADVDAGANMYPVVDVDDAADHVGRWLAFIVEDVVMATVVAAVACEVGAAGGAQQITVSQQQKIGVEPLK